MPLHHLRSGVDICAITTSSSPSRHTTWGQSQLPPRTNITLPDPRIMLAMTGSSGWTASSRKVTRNLLSYSTSARCLGGNNSALMSRSKPALQCRWSGERDASHPKRSPGFGRSYFSFPPRQILSGVQRTFAPASNRLRASESGSGSHTRWTMRCKRSWRRPAWARVEPHGCGETYRSTRRTVDSCTSGSVVVAEDSSVASMKVPGGDRIEKRFRWALTWMERCAFSHRAMGKVFKRSEFTFTFGVGEILG